jgi:hypothetical protein
MRRARLGRPLDVVARAGRLLAVQRDLLRDPPAHQDRDLRLA